MSDLGYLEQLLDGAAVEWMPLGDLGDLVRGNGLPKSDFTEDGVPAIHYGQIYTYYGMSTALTRSFVSPETAAALKKVNAGDVVITNTSENIEDVATPLVYFGREQAVTGGHATVFKPTGPILGMYLAHFMYTPAFDAEKRRYAKGTKVIDVAAVDMAKILIPIPCPDVPQKSLAIQAEIVRILDAFTALTAELTAELTARKTQYNHYRNELLSFEGGEVEWKTLGEVALEFGRGKSRHRPRNDPSLYGGGIPFIQTGDIRNSPHVISTYSQTYSELGLQQSKLWPKGTLCITIAANIAETTILGFDACFPDSVVGFVAHPEKSNAHYVEYLVTSMKAMLEAKSKGSAQDNINLGTFENTRFPFPSLAEQARIVAILDKFDTLTTSLAEGLPREIALRKRQYEHYRNLLLGFPKGAAQ